MLWDSACFEREHSHGDRAPNMTHSKGGGARQVSSLCCAARSGAERGSQQLCAWRCRLSSLGQWPAEQMRVGRAGHASGPCARQRRTTARRAAVRPPCGNPSLPAGQGQHTHHHPMQSNGRPTDTHTQIRSLQADMCPSFTCHNFVSKVKWFPCLLQRAGACEARVSRDWPAVAQGRVCRACLNTHTLECAEERQ